MLVLTAGIGQGHSAGGVRVGGMLASGRAGTELMQFSLEPLHLRLEILKVVSGDFLPFHRVIAHANHLGRLAV